MRTKGMLLNIKTLTRPSGTLSRGTGEGLSLPLPLAGEGRGEGWAEGFRRPALLAVAIALAACSPKGEALYSRAEKSLTAGEINAAVIDLKNLVKDEPQNGKARALLATALTYGGDIGGAAIEIQKARDLGAPAESLLVPECRVMVAKSEFEQAREKCKPDGATGNVKTEMQIAQGRALLGLERAAEAKPQFEAALAAEPDNLDALLGIASATYAVDGLPAAKAVLDKASPDIQKKSAYWMAMGGINVQGEDLPAAEAAYQKALANIGKGDGGERLMALGALAETQMRQGKVDEATKTTDQMIKAAPDNPSVKQLRGQVAAAGGKLDEARTLLEEVVVAMPENYQARTLLGVVNMQQGNLGQAEMHFNAVLANQPDNARVQRMLAELRAKQQTPEESLAALQTTLVAGDVDPTMLAMAGRMSLAAGNREQALAYFTQASAKSPEGQPADVQLEVAGGHLATGNIDRAIELLERMPEGGATSLQREYLLLAALLQKGDTAKAVAEAQELVAKQGDNLQARNLAAGVYAAAGQKAEARQQFNEALKIKADDAGTLINLARLDFSDGKTAEAERGFLKVLDGDPKHLMATVGLAAISASGGKNAEAEKWLTKASADHPDAIEAQLALAQFYMGTREFAKAENVIEAAAKKAPDNAALSNARGLAKMGLNDVPGALASFKQATSQAPRAYGYTLNLARAHLANRDVPAALGVLDGVLKAEPKYAPALALAAATSLQAGQTEKATGYIERLRQAQPDAAGTFMLEGDLAMNQKRYKDALGFYRKAAAKGANSQLVLAEYRAASLAGESKPEKVLEDWAAKNPGDLGVVTALAEHRNTKGDTDGAIALYEAALAKAPDNAVLLNNLAVLYDGKGNAKAAEFAERAYKAAPNAPPIADTYGWILFKQGKTDEALKLIREAAKGLPNNAEVQYHLAAVLARKGEKEEAVALLRKAVRGALPASAKIDAQKLLDQLTK